MDILRTLNRMIRGPRCHLGPDEKDWLERRLVWLHEHFGPEPVRRAPVTPGSRFLPSRWEASYEAGMDLFQRLCDFMQIDPQGLELRFFTREDFHEMDSDYAGEFHSHGPAGLFLARGEGLNPMIALEESALARPAELASTICHELGHLHLSRAHPVEPTEADAEPLTDLLCVYFGAGILLANTAFQFSQWSYPNSRLSGWSASRLGYLTEAQWGYSLACAARYRGERDCPWRRHLRENIAYYFEDSMDFLNVTGRSSIPFDGA